MAAADMDHLGVHGLQVKRDQENAKSNKNMPKHIGENSF